VAAGSATQREALAAAGLPPPWLVGGHAHRRLRLRRGERLALNPDWADSGPLASLRCVPASVLADGFLLVYGDCVFHPALPRAVAGARGAFAVGVDLDWHALWSARFDDVLVDAEALRWGRGGRLDAIGGRAATVDEIQGQFTGLLKVSPAGWRRLRALLDAMPAPRARRIDTTGALAALIEAGHAVRGVPLQGRWVEVDQPRDLALYRARLRSRVRWSHDWRCGLG
jgi:choline kinase